MRSVYLALLLTFAAVGAAAYGLSRWTESAPRNWTHWLGLVAGVVLVPAVAALLWSQAWSHRLRRISAALRRLASGELAGRNEASDPNGSPDIGRSLHATKAYIDRLLAVLPLERQTLASLASHLNEGVVLAGSDGRIILANAAAARLLGLSSSRADGSFEGLAVEECVPQHDLQELLRPKPARPARTAESSDLDGSNFEANADAEIRLTTEGASGPTALLARVRPVTTPRGGIGTPGQAANTETGRLLIVSDISELTRTLQIKTDFVANASHELRTPLSAILAAAETLQRIDASAEPAAAAQFISVIERHARFLQSLVSDLLDLARLESPTARFEHRRIRTEDLMAELYGVFAGPLEAKELHWRVDVAEDGERIVAPPELLRIALRNLIENAVRFTPRGGHVTVRVWKVDRSVSFEVADDGCGIPHEDLERVFERFYQVARARSGAERGTGLGLSIVRHAVTAMGGAVKLASEPNKGTRATVTIPQASDFTADDSTRHPAGHDPKANSAPKSARS